MDGENTSLYHDKIQARSLDSKHHISRDWVKNFHAQIKCHIPKDMCIVGENMWSTHSIKYTGLPSYFLGFVAIQKIEDVMYVLSWEETLIIFEALSIEPVPVLSKVSIKINGSYQPPKISKYGEEIEGYVVWNSSHFLLTDFHKNVAKYVQIMLRQINIGFMNQSNVTC